MNSNFNIKLLKQKWEQLQNIPKVFAYNLNVRKGKYLPGQLLFYTEYNPERTKLRRAPQMISSLNPKYSEDQFNFNKVSPMEHLGSVSYINIDVAFIINKSPLTMYHTLICPDLKGKHGQRITLESISFCISFLMATKDKALRIGYNSPGALASVNHLHWHLLYIESDLYVDKVRLEHFSGKNIYRLSKDMPTEAICWLIYQTDTAQEFETKVNEIYNFIEWLCKCNLPHNVFITFERDDRDLNAVKLFTFAREQYCLVKDVESLNIGFCELAGFFPVGNPELYEAVTEEIITAKIHSETGAVYEKVYKYLIEKNKSQVL